MVLSAFSLQEKIALITGGGTGIGLGIAKAFIDFIVLMILQIKRQFQV